MFKTGAMAFSFSLALLAPTAHAATTIAAQNNACGPGGCFETATTYRQKLNVNPSSPISVSTLLLNRGILGAHQDMIFKLTFETDSGTRISDWGSFMIAGLNGEMVSLGGREFVWKPEYGNLVVRLDLVAPETGGGGGGGGAFGAGGGFGGGGGSFGAGGGPGTESFVAPPKGFASVPPVPAEIGILAVPEPSAWAMMIAGFFGAGAMLRRGRAGARPRPV